MTSVINAARIHRGTPAPPDVSGDYGTVIPEAARYLWERLRERIALVPGDHDPLVRKGHPGRKWKGGLRICITESWPKAEYAGRYDTFVLYICQFLKYGGNVEHIGQNRAEPLWWISDEWREEIPPERIPFRSSGARAAPLLAKWSRREDEGSPGDQDKFYCNVCGISLSSAWYQMKHERMQHFASDYVFLLPWPCPVPKCAEMPFHTDVQFRNHLVREHGIPRGSLEPAVSRSRTIHGERLAARAGACAPERPREAVPADSPPEALTTPQAAPEGLPAVMPERMPGSHPVIAHGMNAFQDMVEEIRRLAEENEKLRAEQGEDHGHRLAAERLRERNDLLEDLLNAMGVQLVEWTRRIDEAGTGGG